MGEIAWYKPAEVNQFKNEHIDFICEWYELLNDGKWPREWSGYTENPYVQQTASFKTDFESATLIIAEFHWRVERCGKDGTIFLAYRCWKLPGPHLMVLTGCDEKALGMVERRVRMYITGRRKKQGYPQFIKHRGYPRFFSSST